MLKDIEDKIDKVYITEKEFKSIAKWNRERKSDFDAKVFFPLRTFILDVYGFKGLVELDGYNPILGGQVTTDGYFYRWKRDGHGFQFDGEGNKEVIEIAHTLIMGCLLYICTAERTTQFRQVVERARETGYEPHEYTDRVCFLLKDIIRYTGTHQTKKSVKYSCECWGVRGHLRHYDNGHVSFIAPYKKGKKRDVLEPRSKTYLLGESCQN